MARRARSSSRRPEGRLARGGHTVVYGRNAVREALRGRRRVHRIWATQAAAKDGWTGAPLTFAALTVSSPLLT